MVIAAATVGVCWRGTGVRPHCVGMCWPRRQRVVWALVLACGHCDLLAWVERWGGVGVVASIRD
jgi:hypothetical protein